MKYVHEWMDIAAFFFYVGLFVPIHFSSISISRLFVKWKIMIFFKC